MASTDKIYQLKVTLRGSKPPIWRRLLVPASTNLFDLHKIIQVAMGWENGHLHQFIIAGQYYSIPSKGDWMAMLDERQHQLAQVAPGENSRFVYEYDFGDSWEHEIRVEKILPLDPQLTYPCCIKGKKACPPEDIGGVWGFAEFVEAMKDPNHEEHESYLEWWGGPYDPDAFDLDEINQQLQKIHDGDWW